VSKRTTQRETRTHSCRRTPCQAPCSTRSPLRSSPRRRRRALLHPCSASPSRARTTTRRPRRTRPTHGRGARCARRRRRCRPGSSGQRCAASCGAPRGRAGRGGARRSSRWGRGRGCGEVSGRSRRAAADRRSGSARAQGSTASAGKGRRRTSSLSRSMLSSAAGSRSRSESRRSSPALLLRLLAALPSSSIRASSSAAGRDIGCGAWVRAARGGGGGGVGACCPREAGSAGVRAHRGVRRYSQELGCPVQTCARARERERGESAEVPLSSADETTSSLSVEDGAVLVRLHGAAMTTDSARTDTRRGSSRTRRGLARSERNDVLAVRSRTLPFTDRPSVPAPRRASARVSCSEKEEKRGRGRTARRASTQGSSR